MCSRQEGFILDSADNFRRTGKHLTHEEWEQQQNKVYERFNGRNIDGNIKNPGCACGKQNNWDDNYCARCGNKL